MLLALVRMVYKMANNLASTDITQDDNSKEKIRSLFKYIQELNKLKRKNILNVKDYDWCLWIKNLPYDAENIKIFYLIFWIICKQRMEILTKSPFFFC